MCRQQWGDSTRVAHLRQCNGKLAAEGDGITQLRFFTMPNIGVVRLAKGHGNVSQALRHRDVPVAGFGLGWADFGRSLGHGDGLLDFSDRAICLRQSIRALPEDL